MSHRDRGTPRHRGGSGEPLILIHGLLGHLARVGKPVLALLEPFHDVLAIDAARAMSGGPEIRARTPLSVAGSRPNAGRTRDGRGGFSTPPMWPATRWRAGLTLELGPPRPAPASGRRGLAPRRRLGV